jgi:S1-C subfamily serine protease
MHLGGTTRVLVATSLVIAIAVSDAHSQPAPFSWAPLIELNEKRTVLIRVETADQDDEYGSGIVVGPLGYIFTAKHVLGTNAAASVVSGLLDWTDPSVNFDGAIPLKVVYVSATNDFAVLKIAGAGQMPRGISLDRQFSSGDPIMLMGYPSGGNLTSTFGFVSGNANGSRFKSDVKAGGGNSGGPVISAANRLIGQLVEKNSRTDDGTIELSYALSADAIASDLADAGVVVDVYQPGKMSNRPIEVGTAPALIDVSYGFDDTKDDHPSLSPDRRTYRYVKAAQPGYVIRTAKVVVEHRNNVSAQPVTEITDGGRSVVVTYQLESGPIFDRWRGWIDGRVETQQQIEQ